MERPTCKTCPYWETYEDDEEKRKGLCHRRAPQTTGFSQTESWSNYPFANWIQTEWLEWCGEHPDFPAYITSLNEEKDASDPRKTVKQRFEPPMSHQP